VQIYVSNFWVPDLREAVPLDQRSLILTGVTTLLRTEERQGEIWLCSFWFGFQASDYIKFHDVFAVSKTSDGTEVVRESVAFHEVFQNLCQQDPANLSTFDNDPEQATLAVVDSFSDVRFTFKFLLRTQTRFEQSVLILEMKDVY
jgi:hypothetical protein